MKFTSKAKILSVAACFCAFLTSFGLRANPDQPSKLYKPHVTSFISLIQTGDQIKYTVTNDGCLGQENYRLIKSTEVKPFLTLIKVSEKCHNYARDQYLPGEASTKTLVFYLSDLELENHSSYRILLPRKAVDVPATAVPRDIWLFCQNYRIHTPAYERCMRNQLHLLQPNPK